jgi:hypothetical protein
MTLTLFFLRGFRSLFKCFCRRPFLACSHLLTTAGFYSGTFIVNIFVQAHFDFFPTHFHLLRLSRSGEFGLAAAFGCFFI